MEKPTQNGDSDQDFDPSAEMLVNDFDDEHTLEEEEAMESGESVGNELDELQKEGEMPLDDLLAMYGLGNNTNDSNPNPTTTKKEVPLAKPIPPTPPLISLPPPLITIQPQPPEVTITVKQPIEIVLPPPIKEIPVQVEEKNITVPKPVEKAVPVECVSATRHLLRACKSVSQPSESSGSDSDDDGSPDDDWRKTRLRIRLKSKKNRSLKTIQVGSDYQAQIPEGLCKYDGAPAYENEDRLLWDPAKLGDDEVEEYLRQAQMPHSSSSSSTPSPGGVTSLPNGGHVRDDEQALYLLLQCGHSVEEALRRRRMQPTHATDTMSLWSEEECRSFENGLRTYGKQFHAIQQNKVRTRAVGELVQFYYLWKKTERHDVFASKNRLEKKKYSLHPGTTDYMDRFLDEQENPSMPRDRSSSPNTQSLLYGDRKQVTSSTNAGSRPVSTSSPPNSNLSQSSTGANQSKNHSPPNSNNLTTENAKIGHNSSSLTSTRSPSINDSKNVARDGGGGASALNGVDKPPLRSRNWLQTQSSNNNNNNNPALVQNSSQMKEISTVLQSETNYSSASSLQDSTVSSGN